MCDTQDHAILYPFSNVLWQQCVLSHIDPLQTVVPLDGRDLHKGGMMRIAYCTKTLSSCVAMYLSFMAFNHSGICVTSLVTFGRSQDQLGGSFPETAEQLRKIPGVGPYTAAAVASIAFDYPAAAVDGNVIRVTSRLRSVRGDPSKQVNVFDRLAAQLLHNDRPGCHNQVCVL